MISAHTVAVEAKKRMDAIRPGLFEQLVWRCMSWGVVVKRPDLLLLAEPVWTDGKRILGETKRKPNCWWIHALVGSLDIQYFMSLAEPTMYVGWERNGDGKLKIYKWKRVMRDE